MLCLVLQMVLVSMTAFPDTFCATSLSQNSGCHIFFKKDSEAICLSKLSEKAIGRLLQDFSEPCHSTFTRR